MVLLQQRLQVLVPVVKPRRHETRGGLVFLHEFECVCRREFARESPTQIIAERVADLEDFTVPDRPYGNGSIRRRGRGRRSLDR